MPGPEPLGRARREFAPACTYLDTATAGLPCRRTLEAMDDDLRAWGAGRLAATGYDDVVARCRELWAALVGAPAGWVSVGNQVSPLVGLVAASLPAGAAVVGAAEDFTSVLFPFLAQEARGVRVRTVPLDRLCDEIPDGTTWVAVSVAQSADGRVVDTARLRAAADAAGARVLLDGTQSVGWHHVDPAHWDVLVCGTYKWLCSPRGTAFAAWRPEVAEQVVPHAAGWFAGDDVWSSIYGPPLRLAADARRFDVSPAWLCWTGTLPALELLAEVGVDAIGAHDVGLADLVRTRLGLAPGDGPVVRLEVEGAAERLAAAGIAAAVRAGRVRVGFHLYNTEDDVDALVAALG